MDAIAVTGYFGAMPASTDWPAVVPTRILLMTLSKGKNPLSVIYGKKSQVARFGTSLADSYVDAERLAGRYDITGPPTATRLIGNLG